MGWVAVVLGCAAAAGPARRGRRWVLGWVDAVVEVEVEMELEIDEVGVRDRDRDGGRDSQRWS